MVERKAFCRPTLTLILIIPAGTQGENQISPHFPTSVDLRYTLKPTSPPLSSLFSARWFLSGLFSFFQLGSISRQLWVSCYRASLGNDQEKLTCKSWLSLSKSFLSNQVSFRAAFSCFNDVNLSLTCFTRGLEANIF